MAVGPVVAVGRCGSIAENGCCGGGNVHRRCGLSRAMRLPEKEDQRQVQQSQMWWARQACHVSQRDTPGSAV